MQGAGAVANVSGLVRRAGVGGASWWIAGVGVLVPLVCLALPMFVIRPFVPQDPWQLAAALTVRGMGPWISAICAVIVVLVVARAWGPAAKWWGRAGLVTLAVVAIAEACLTQVNIFEIMFHPYPAPVFVEAGAAGVDGDDKVLAVTLSGEAHGYPIRTMGYHHIVNDTLGNEPIAVTYCTLCHTGLVWSRVLEGRTLHFRLAGINNGNALIRDEETSSIWQQSTGQAIFGPLKGKQLKLVHSDELTYALWRSEEPKGRVLKPDAEYASEYESKDWEKHIEKTHVVIDTSRTGFGPHELMLGVTVDGMNKAYPVKAIAAAKVIEDRVGTGSIVIVQGPDGASMRVFRAGTAMTFLTANDAVGNEKAVLRDAETGSLWNFKGCAVSGAMNGKCLEAIDSNKDYWFDWKNHHPGTLVLKS